MAIKGQIEGWNTILMNRKTLRNIVQFYFDTVLFNGPEMKGQVPQVRTVKWNNVTDGLQIDCENPVTD